MKSLVVAVSLCACGRIGFDDLARTTDAAIDGAPVDDAASDAAAGLTVFHELTGEYTFDPMSFGEGTEAIDNEPRSLCVLSAPFSSPLAVLAGRQILEVSLTGPIIVHDYTPGGEDGPGPDSLSDCNQVASTLWIGAASPATGDGVYGIAADWTSTKIDPAMEANNVGALADLEGQLIYATDSEVIVLEPRGLLGTIDAGMRINAMRLTSPSLLANLSTGGLDNNVLGTLFPMMSGTMLEFTAFDIPLERDVPVIIAADAVPPAPGLAYIILNERDLGVVDADGTFHLIASVPGPDTFWKGLAAPPEGHPLAGALYVMEVDRVLNRDRILRISI